MHKNKNATSQEFKMMNDPTRNNFNDTSKFFTQQSIMEQSSPMMNTMMNTTSTFFNINPEDNMSKATLNRHSHRQTFIDPVGADQEHFTTNCFKKHKKKFDMGLAYNKFHQTLRDGEVYL